MRTAWRDPPQLALRVAVLGAIGFVLFAVVFFRLWYLQVLSGARFVAAANANRVRDVPIPAPRGDIVDRHGVDLVRTRRAAVVQIVPSSLPPAVRAQAEGYREALAHTARAVPIPPLPASETGLARLYRRIGRVLEIRPRTLHERVIRGLADAPYENVTLRTDVPPAEFEYMRERPELFPGVDVASRYIRDYPHGRTAAQVLGPVTGGLEREYDRYLRGTDGTARVVVDAQGQRDERRKASVTEPTQGERLELTLDLGLQEAGDRALKRALASSKYPTNAGAWVALDPRSGAIYGMGSQPGFDAGVFARPFSQGTYDALTSPDRGAPLLDRVTESAYPTGSTFKPVTALAALESGLIGPADTFDDTGSWTLGTQRYRNAGGAALGVLDTADALKVSSDLFFFRLGAAADARGDVIQRWARQLGFGHRTGIDLPGESAGLVPDRSWRTRGYRAYLACVRKAGLTAGAPATLQACGGIDKPWTPGDDANLAVGQGDLQATPLQIAVAYAAIANGGTVVRPHLGRSIEDGDGAKLQDLDFTPRRKVHLDAGARQVVLDGLRRAAGEQGGTSADVFAGWPKRYRVYGKTGTAERGQNPDQAWYACFVDDPKRPLVVVVTVEKGGFGAATAAPAARQILAKWFRVADHAFHTGASTTF